MLNDLNKFQIKFSINSAKLFCAVLLLACFLSITGYAESFKTTLETDLDFDGRKEQIDVNSERKQSLQIRRGKKLLWQGIPSGWKPWRLEIADVDGDGRREIIVGVFKSTKFFPKPHNCLFVYGFAGERAFPKWLGSSLARTFTDFTFADLDGDEKSDELIALETTLEGKKSLAVYGWNSFGFTLEWQRGEWETAKLSKAENGQILIEADGERSFLAKDKKR